jgi:outer membrane lipoprotein LolB
MNHHPQSNRLARGVLAFTLTVLLIGCESMPDLSKLLSLPGVDPRAEWQAHLNWLESLNVWRTSGRVAVQVPDDGWSASLRWRQSDDDYRIHLSGPFGQGAVRIEGSASAVVLRTADGRERRAATPEKLIAAELNAEVPVSLLRFWILGRPAPAPAPEVEELQLDEAGRLLRLAQAGWLITYQEYEAHDAGDLPKRLRIEHGQTAARFVLSSWRIGG